ncbi:MAG: UDP-galactopyranose mutase [Acidimicrobiales bacterium]|nr:UDP-galactopyranose mutase [Acidimicrobiales bacterium]
MPADDDRPLVIVVGAGITGLATAWHLQRSGAVRVVVVEGSDRVGGKLSTASIAGVEVDSGADCFLARVPWMTALCLDVGINDLTSPATGTAYVWSGHRLRRLPEGLVLGVPTSATALARSRLLSPGASLRAAMDLVTRAAAVDGPDPSVGAVVADRLGRRALQQVVEPLLGGIHAGMADRLSLREVAPLVADAAAGHRSLIRGLRAQRKATTPAGGPVFLAPVGGMGRLVDRLHEHLLADGAEIRTGTVVEKLTPAAGGRTSVFPTGLFADHVVLTTPAFAAAQLVRPHTTGSADALDGIAYASLAMVLLAYPTGDAPLPAGSGFLVPRTAGRLLTAASFLTNKWPGTGPPGHVVVRCSIGHIADDRGVTMADAALVDGAHAELVEALHLRSGVRPADAVVVRWPRAFPQYEPGHRTRVERARNFLHAELPDVSLAGAAYDGLGLAACARQGEEAATQTLQKLGLEEGNRE